MKQKYFLYLIFIFLFTLNSFAQEKKSTPVKTENIEGLQVYPNPVTNGRIYITTDQNSSIKEIELYDMLGKKIYSITLYNNNKEINVSNLNPGVYMIKIKENNANATRKLVIK